MVEVEVAALIPMILLFAAAIFCGVQAIRAERLIMSSLWLAGVSALVAGSLYLMGAYEVAVIELSVGAGLVTVLFVFAISMSGEVDLKLPSIVPRPLAAVLVAAAAGLLVLSLWGRPIPIPVVIPPALSQVLWTERALDMLLQVVLIFAGVMGLLGLLTTPDTGSMPDVLSSDVDDEVEADEQKESAGAIGSNGRHFHPARTEENEPEKEVVA